MLKQLVLAGPCVDPSEEACEQAGVNIVAETLTGEEQVSHDAAARVRGIAHGYITNGVRQAVFALAAGDGAPGKEQFSAGATWLSPWERAF